MARTMGSLRKRSRTTKRWVGVSRVLLALHAKAIVVRHSPKPVSCSWMTMWNMIKHALDNIMDTLGGQSLHPLVQRWPAYDRFVRPPPEFVIEKVLYSRVCHCI